MIVNFYNQKYDPTVHQIVWVLETSMSKQDLLTFHVQRDDTGKNSSLISINETLLSKSKVHSILLSKVMVFSLNKRIYMQAISSVEENNRLLTITGVDFLTFVFKNMIPLGFQYPNPLSADTHYPYDESWNGKFGRFPYLTQDKINAVNKIRKMFNNKYSLTLGHLLQLMFSSNSDKLDLHFTKDVQARTVGWNYKSGTPNCDDDQVDAKYFKSFLNVGLTSTNTNDNTYSEDPMTISQILDGVAKDLNLIFTPVYTDDFKGSNVQFFYNLQISDKNSQKIDQEAQKMSIKRISSQDVVNVTTKIDYSNIFANVVASGSITHKNKGVDKTPANGKAISSKPEWNIKEATTDDEKKAVQKAAEMFTIARSHTIADSSDTIKNLDFCSDKSNGVIKISNYSSKQAVVDPEYMGTGDYSLLSSRYGLSPDDLNAVATATVQDKPKYSWIDRNHFEYFNTYDKNVNSWHNLPLLTVTSGNYSAIMLHYCAGFVPLPGDYSSTHVLSIEYMTNILDKFRQYQKIMSKPVAEQFKDLQDYMRNLYNDMDMDEQDPTYMAMIPGVDETWFKKPNLKKEEKEKLIPLLLIVKKSDLVEKVNLNLNTSHLINMDNVDIDGLTPVNNYGKKTGVKGKFYALGLSYEATGSDKAGNPTFLDAGSHHTSNMYFTDTAGNMQLPTVFYKPDNIQSVEQFNADVKDYAAKHKDPIITITAEINSGGIFHNATNGHVVEPGDAVEFTVSKSKLFKTQTLYTTIKSIDYNMLNLHLSKATLNSVDYYQNSGD